VKRLAREILVPAAVLTAVALAALAYAGWESVRQSRALERDSAYVRRATALALGITDAVHEEERRVAALAAGPGGADGAGAARIREAGERLEAIAAEIASFPLAPRAADVWGRFLESRRALVAVGGEVVASARRGDPAATSMALQKWNLLGDRSDRLLSSFTAYHLNRLDRTVAELQRRRVRALALAGLAIVAGLLVAGGFAALLDRKVVRPLVEMANAARRIQATGAASPVAGGDRRDELGVLARAFNDMTERLVSANATLASSNASLAEAVRARQDFISIASHELKTPITPLVLRVQQLGRVARAAGEGLVPPAQVAEAARTLEGHVLKLKRLVENLLDVSRIDSGQLALRVEELPLAGVIRDALERVAEDLAASRCEVRVEGAADVVVRGDRMRIEQVLVNLVGNAAKYAPGGPVMVRVAVGAGAVEVQVEDAGPGITPADQQRIFQRFERAPPERHVTGLGLGLYIARAIVRAHGGELSVRSEPGHGATFTMSLPREAPAPPAPGRREPAELGAPSPER